MEGGLKARIAERQKSWRHIHLEACMRLDRLQYEGLAACMPRAWTLGRQLEGMKVYFVKAKWFGGLEAWRLGGRVAVRLKAWRHGGL